MKNIANELVEIFSKVKPPEDVVLNQKLINRAINRLVLLLYANLKDSIENGDIKFYITMQTFDYYNLNYLQVHGNIVRAFIYPHLKNFLKSQKIPFSSSRSWFNSHVWDFSFNVKKLKEFCKYEKVIALK